MIVTDETFGCVLTAAALMDAVLSRKTEIQISDHVRILLVEFRQKRPPDVASLNANSAV